MTLEGRITQLLLNTDLLPGESRWYVRPTPVAPWQKYNIGEAWASAIGLLWIVTQGGQWRTFSLIPSMRSRSRIFWTDTQDWAGKPRAEDRRTIESFIEWLCRREE